MSSGNDLIEICFSLVYRITLAFVWGWEPKRWSGQHPGCDFYAGPHEYETEIKLVLIPTQH
jgi:hypothetical protein